MLLRARQFEFQFPRPTLLMGIVNVTPDSFSDGGRYLQCAEAVAQAGRLMAEGADIIDIGGESTRPNACPVPEEEELRRVLPVIRELVRNGGGRVVLSIDTMKPAVARAAVEAGASLINDVATNREDDAMARVARETGAALVLMHMRGTPRTMQSDPQYEDVVGEVNKFLIDRLSRLALAGVSPEQSILDPGFGFGKTVEHNLELLARLGQFGNCRRPVLAGVSRKAFIGQVTGVPEAADRLAGSLAAACAAVAGGAGIIRTHDVAATRQSVRMWEAIAARKS